MYSAYSSAVIFVSLSSPTRSMRTYPPDLVFLVYLCSTSYVSKIVFRNSNLQLYDFQIVAKNWLNCLLQSCKQCIIKIYNIF